MRPLDLTRLLPVVLLLLSACDNSDNNGNDPEPEPPPQRGELIGEVSLVASYTPAELLALAADDEVTQLLLEELLSPDCDIDVYHYEYNTIDPDGELTPASAALMLPNDAGEPCQGERPIVMYAHGTSADKTYNLAELEANGEGLLMAAVFAAEGYIVVAPNYVGYDTSTLGYHPYLNGEQQSSDMIDALAAARSALPTTNAPDTTDDGRLLVTGYSQGGYVAMATHRALQEAGETVTASAPMSGPYALTAFADAIFQGRVTGGSPVNLTLLLTSYQNTYGNIYSSPTDAYEAQYATGIETLLPSTMSLGELEEEGLLPDTALFSNTPPDPVYADITPATTPASLAPVFATGFGPDNLLTNDFRLAYLQDSEINPDGGFPTVTDGLPPENPEHPLREALASNDQRTWTPTSPMLLCAGNADPTVLYLNTGLMQLHWASEPSVSILDIDSPPFSNDPYETQKVQFAAAKELVELTGGEEAVFENYHAGLVAPFCLSAVKSFFDGF
ncbi:MAG TPA: prolyl oligopeptidase family serine peptidase [Dehalococcoidia bacterium]|nr:prolyl oligopeptidase family serine peptidase [Dehalococcoidia bacterium]